MVSYLLSLPDAPLQHEPGSKTKRAVDRTFLLYGIVIQYSILRRSDQMRLTLHITGRASHLTGTIRTPLRALRLMWLLDRLAAPRAFSFVPQSPSYFRCPTLHRSCLAGLPVLHFTKLARLYFPSASRGSNARHHRARHVTLKERYEARLPRSGACLCWAAFDGVFSLVLDTLFDV